MFDEPNVFAQFAVVLTQTTMLGLECLDGQLPLQSVITVSKMAFSLETSCVDVCSAVFCCFTVKQNIAPCAWILTLQFTKVAKMKEWRQRGATSLSATDFSILKSPKPRGEKHFSALS